MSDVTFWWLLVLSVINIVLILVVITHSKMLGGLSKEIIDLKDHIGTRFSRIWKKNLCREKYSIVNMIDYLHKELRNVNSSKDDIWKRCVRQFERLERIDEDQSLLLNELGYKIDIEPAKPRKRVIVKQEEEEE